MWGDVTKCYLQVFVKLILENCPNFVKGHCLLWSLSKAAKKSKNEPHVLMGETTGLSIS